MRDSWTVPVFAAVPVFELDVMTFGMRGTEALSNPQWLPLLYESEHATLAPGAILFIYLFKDAACNWGRDC